MATTWRSGTSGETCRKDRSSGPEGGVLAAERHAAQRRFEAPCRLGVPGQQQEMARPDLAQAAGSHQFSGCASPEQDSVPIELTARDGKAGQRVVRIVLDDADESP